MPKARSPRPLFSLFLFLIRHSLLLASAPVLDPIKLGAAKVDGHGHFHLAEVEALGVGSEAGFDDLLDEVHRSFVIHDGGSSLGSSLSSLHLGLSCPAFGFVGMGLSFVGMGLSFIDAGHLPGPLMVRRDHCLLSRGHPLRGNLDLVTGRLQLALQLPKLADQFLNLLIGRLQPGRQQGLPGLSSRSSGALYLRLTLRLLCTTSQGFLPGLTFLLLGPTFVSKMGELLRQCPALGLISLGPGYSMRQRFPRARHRFLEREGPVGQLHPRKPVSHAPDKT